MSHDTNGPFLLSANGSSLRAKGQWDRVFCQSKYRLYLHGSQSSVCKLRRSHPVNMWLARPSIPRSLHAGLTISSCQLRTQITNYTKMGKTSENDVTEDPALTGKRAAAYRAVDEHIRVSKWSVPSLSADSSRNTIVIIYICFPW